MDIGNYNKHYNQDTYSDVTLTIIVIIPATIILTNPGLNVAGSRCKRTIATHHLFHVNHKHQPRQ